MAFGFLLNMRENRSLLKPIAFIKAKIAKKQP